MRRRSFLTAAGAAAAAGLALKSARDHDEAALRADVFVARAASYTEDLEQILRSGLRELGLGPAVFKGKSVLLKPNLVEPSRTDPQINTHPAVVRAAAEVFRRWQAARSSWPKARGTAAIRSTFSTSRAWAGAGRVEARIRRPQSRRCLHRAQQPGLHPAARADAAGNPARADLIVSMPKMKTHHWAGVTLALKNLFGVMPGICYGWPKNVLHHAGIPESILDIAATVRPHLAIVDGIIGMEGDGPIMGTPKASGVLVMGTNLPAVDATCARLMGIDPWRVAYLAGASGRLGPIAQAHITQRGESIAPLVQPYQLLNDPSLAGLRG